jgi:hypothetical protein
MAAGQSLSFMKPSEWPLILGADIPGSGRQGAGEIEEFLSLERFRSLTEDRDASFAFMRHWIFDI